MKLTIYLQCRTDNSNRQGTQAQVIVKLECLNLQISGPYSKADKNGGKDDEDDSKADHQLLTIVVNQTHRDDLLRFTKRLCEE